MADANPEKLTIRRDGKGRNQAIGMISFKNLLMQFFKILVYNINNSSSLATALSMLSLTIW